MPVARPTIPKVADGRRLAALIRRAIAPFLTEAGSRISRASSWEEALAMLSVMTTPAITAALGPGIREVLEEVDRRQLLLFRQNVRHLVSRDPLAREALRTLSPLNVFERTRGVLRAVHYGERLPELFRTNLTKRISKLQERGVGFTSARLRKAIAMSQSVVRNRATLIGVDQNETFHGELAMRRQLAIGVTHFEIVTRLDNRVRPHHAIEHGRVYPWAGPYPYVPGEPINCRCRAAPVFGPRPGVDARIRATGR